MEHEARYFVMPGLDPGIQSHRRLIEILDRRVKPGDDENPGPGAPS